MKKPNFFLVGAGKSGTTALYYFLKKHPQIFMPEVKEPRFFCTDFHQESDEFHGKKVYYPYRKLSDYLKLFEDANTDVVGECSPVYLFSKEAAKNIAEFNSDAKIIIIVRNPVDLLYSIHGQLLNTGKENIQDFDEAINAEDNRKGWENIPKTIRVPSTLYYSDLAKFKKHIERYYQVFPRNQIKIIVYEDFRKDNELVFKEVLQFLGVDDKFTPNYRKHNLSLVPRNSLVKKLFFNRVTTSVTDMMPLKSKDRLKKLLSPLIYKKGVREPLDECTRRELMKQFKTDVEELSDYLGIDFVRKWGYNLV